MLFEVRSKRYTLLHLSDLHLDVGGEFVARLVDAVQGLTFDACVLRGVTFACAASKMTKQWARVGPTRRPAAFEVKQSDRAVLSP